MKCPLLFDYINIGEYEGSVAVGNCLEKECAWWGLYRLTETEDVSCCSLPAIALALTDILNKKAI